MSEWKEVVLEDITSRIGDGLHGTPKYDANGDYFFINGNNLKGGKILIKPDTKKVTNEEAIKHERPLSDRTLLLSINGTIGNLAFYNYEKCMLGKSACYININENVSVPFMYYHFLSEEFQFYIEMIATGTTIPNVPLKGIRQYTFNLPSEPEQNAIAEILSSLDDKIDLLHRQNQTLEQMAETLFRQWFVEEADEGWEEGDIYEVLNVVYGYPFKSKRFNEEGVGLPLIRIRDLKKGESQFYTDEECDSKFEINCGDLIAGMDGEFRLYLWKGKKSLLNQRVCKFEPKDSSIPPLFIFGLMKPHLYYYENVKVGTTVIHLGKSDLDEIRIQVPDHDTLMEFGKITNPMFEKLKVNYEQIRTLTALRDTLLPKLMSGEIRINTDA